MNDIQSICGRLPAFARVIRQSILAAVLLLYCVFSGLQVQATESPLKEEQVTAAFIYNFVKFVTWPDGTFEDKQGRLHVCTNEPDSLGGALAALSDRAVDGISLDVRYIRNGNGFPVSSCDVLYIDGELPLSSLSLPPEPSSLLVIGHSQPGTEPARSIVFRKVDKKIRFDIYLNEAKRAGLDVSSFLLKLALNVYE